MLKNAQKRSAAFKDLDQIPGLSRPEKCDSETQGLSRMHNNLGTRKFSQFILHSIYQ